MNETTTLHVEGMTCANCANTITKALQKEGLKEINVNYLTTEVSFEQVEENKLSKVKERIDSLGYKVIKDTSRNNGHADEHHEHVHGHSKSVEKRFWWAAVFTFPLMLHMFLPFTLFHEPLFQLLLCIPVMIIGLTYFGKSAWGSVKAGLPNMDVLIVIGSSAAFIYSLIGMVLYANTHEVHQYMFFETAAAILTFVLLGNFLEQISVKRTTSALHELSKLQPQKAKRINLSDQENVTEIRIEEITVGDILLVNDGDRIPVDGKVKWGSASVNEAMITGESIPVHKTIADTVIGGTIIQSGSIKMVAERVGNETTLSKIIAMVKQAQLFKPNIQRLGDRISNIFVPIVLLIAAVTFAVSYLAFNISAQQSLMRSIAVLVIACPCAMGLATPTALMVGIGMAARKGILIKGGATVEQFAGIKTIVFDKTGTLTTGKFRVKKIESSSTDVNELKTILYSLEQHSSHPIAKSIVSELSSFSAEASNVKWKNLSEDKGIGINASDENGNLYSVGSYLMAKHVTKEGSHNLYLLKNNELIATIDLEDEIKAGTKEMISELKSAGIKTVMISGDRKSICDSVAQQTGIDEVYSEQLPKQKLEIIERLSKQNLTAMVGDGINDAPALAKANVGISLSGATQVAIQSAQIVLLHANDLTYLIKALNISKKTLLTIKQNLFWAFFYNVIAIPVAAVGLLSPMIAALSMAFSDVFLIGNSLRLRTKKIS
jgi:P-type Cu+ transporter